MIRRDDSKSTVAVTGMGCVSSSGLGIEQTWDALVNYQSAPIPVPVWIFETQSQRPAFIVRQATSSLLNIFRQSDLSGPDDYLAYSSRTFLLLLVAVVEALKQADITPQALAGLRVGIAIGTTVGSTFNNEPYYAAWREGKRPDLLPVKRFLSENLAAALHRILDTQGPSIVVNNACASGTDAIGIASEWLQAGLCDLAICGGADELSRQAYLGFSSLLLYDEQVCKPFDQHRQGLNLGEGAGVLVLESKSRISAQSSKRIGWVRGYATASDAWHPTAPHPEGRGLRTATSNALDNASCKSTDICFVNAHGTGTKANDNVEMKVLSDTFQKNNPPVVSTKGLTGHTLGAAGALEAIFALLALNNGMTMGTAHCQQADLAFSLPPLRHGERKNLDGKIGISQSLAFGGTNSVLVLEAM